MSPSVGIAAAATAAAAAAAAAVAAASLPCTGRQDRLSFDRAHRASLRSINIPQWPYFAALFSKVTHAELRTTIPHLGLDCTAEVYAIRPAAFPANKWWRPMPPFL